MNALELALIEFTYRAHFDKMNGGIPLFSDKSNYLRRRFDYATIRTRAYQRREEARAAGRRYNSPVLLGERNGDGRQ